jgi:hypothetical protein
MNVFKFNDFAPEYRAGFAKREQRNSTYSIDRS